uniref:FBA_2 domain-containing protein n=1 Tax=Caenorhabditis tropicalis TaxID=1561998 RepID=A0A1I7TF86_9PELO
MFLIADQKPLQLSFTNSLSSQNSIIFLKETTELLKWEEVSIGGKKIPFVSNSPDKYDIYCDDLRVDLVKLLDYIFDVFDVTPAHIWAIPPFLWVLELSKKKTEKLSFNFCEKDESSHESEDKFREVLKTDIMWIGLPSNFRYTGSFAKLEYFRFVHSTWLSLENLFSLGETVVRIDLVCCSNFTKYDINAFIKHWFNNNMKKFRFLRFKFENKVGAEIYNGLEEHLLTVDRMMYFQSGPVAIAFEAGLFPVLRRNDGKIAAICGLENDYSTICIWNNIDCCYQKKDINVPQDFYF